MPENAKGAYEVNQPIPVLKGGDNAELIARLRARKGFGRFPMDAAWFQLDQPDKDCTDAADALAKAAERIAELERERDGWRTDALLAESRVVESNQRAEAAEAKIAELKLELHSVSVGAKREAGMLKLRTQLLEAAEAKVGELEHESRQRYGRALIAESRAEKAEARATALEAKAKTFERAFILSNSAHSKLHEVCCEEAKMTPKMSAALKNGDVVYSQIRELLAALAQSGEG